jgi:hypothetical protein
MRGDYIIFLKKEKNQMKEPLVLVISKLPEEFDKFFRRPKAILFFL